MSKMSTAFGTVSYGPCSRTGVTILGATNNIFTIIKCCLASVMLLRTFN